jgi:hypothetical protein
MRSWLTAANRVVRHTGNSRYIQGSIRDHENVGKTYKLVYLLYSVNAVLGVCMYSVSTHYHGMEG